MVKKKPKKQRAEHYEKPLHIEGTFDAVIGVALLNADEAAKKAAEQVKHKEKIEGGATQKD